MEAKKRVWYRKEAPTLCQTLEGSRDIGVMGVKTRSPKSRQSIKKCKNVHVTLSKAEGKKRSSTKPHHVLYQKIKRRQLEWCSDHTVFSASTLSWRALEAYIIHPQTNVQGMLLKVSLSPSPTEFVVPQPFAFPLPPKIGSATDNWGGVVCQRGHLSQGLVAVFPFLSCGTVQNWDF